MEPLVSANAIRFLGYIEAEHHQGVESFRLLSMVPHR